MQKHLNNLFVKNECTTIKFLNHCKYIHEEQNRTYPRKHPKTYFKLKKKDQKGFKREVIYFQFQLVSLHIFPVHRKSVHSLIRLYLRFVPFSGAHYLLSFSGGKQSYENHRYIKEWRDKHICQPDLTHFRDGAQGNTGTLVAPLLHCTLSENVREIETYERRIF